MPKSLQIPRKALISTDSFEIVRLWMRAPDSFEFHVSLVPFDTEAETYAKLLLELAYQITKLYSTERNLDEQQVRSEILKGLTSGLTSNPSQTTGSLDRPH